MKEVYFTQRFIAYIIDMLIITIASSVVLSIVSLALPTDDKAEKAINEFYDAYYELLGLNTGDNEEKEETEESEIVPVGEDGEETTEITTSDEPVAVEEPEEVQEEKTEEESLKDFEKFFDEQKGNLYIMEKETNKGVIFEIILCLAYFGAFQFFNNGQTLGKKVASIKVVSNDDNKNTYVRMLIRSCFNYNLFSKALMFILLLILNKDNFMVPIYIIETVAGLFTIVSVMFVAFSKKGRSLADIICHTKVVSSK